MSSDEEEHLAIHAGKSSVLVQCDLTAYKKIAGVTSRLLLRDVKAVRNLPCPPFANNFRLGCFKSEIDV